MKGQLEISFQWIFVVLAGGAFLVIFFLLFRSCTNQGDEQVQASVLKYQAATINGAVWQPGEKSSTLDAIPACAGGTPTLNKNDLALPITVPAFLSPTLGKTTIVTKEIALSAPATPTLPLGNVLYGIDLSTNYYVVKDSDEKYKELIAFLPQVKAADTIPDDAIVASYRPFTTEDGKYGVSFTEEQVTFYSKGPSGWVEVKTVPAAGIVLQAGALIAADPVIFGCAKEQLVRRVTYLQTLYSARISALPASDCTPTLAAANTVLSRSAATDLLNPDSQNSLQLVRYQQALNGMRCPVIG